MWNRIVTLKPIAHTGTHFPLLAVQDHMTTFATVFSNYPNVFPGVNWSRLNKGKEQKSKHQKVFTIQTEKPPQQFLMFIRNINIVYWWKISDNSRVRIWVLKRTRGQSLLIHVYQKGKCDESHSLALFTQCSVSFSVTFSNSSMIRRRHFENDLCTQDCRENQKHCSTHASLVVGGVILWLNKTHACVKTLCMKLLVLGNWLQP